MACVPAAVNHSRAIEVARARKQHIGGCCVVS
jgi:hypothetical protein